MVSSPRLCASLAGVALGLGACARPNPSFGAEDGTGTGTGASSSPSGTGPSTSTSASGTAGGATSVEGTSEPKETEDDATTEGWTESEGTGYDTETIAESTGPGCEIIILDVESDTFVSNADSGCKGSCVDWTFTGVENYDIETAGQLDVVALLRFVPPEAVGAIDAARVDFHIIGPLPPGVGLFEVHVLDTTSEWIDGSAMGPIPGQPTFTEARSGQQEWQDGEGEPVPDFDALRDNWPTVPVLAGDEDDGVLELPIQPEDGDLLQARLSAAAPVIIGITVLGGADGAVTVQTMEGGAPAELRLTVCR